MQLSKRTISLLLERYHEHGTDWSTASQYGEPGYSFRHDATTPLVVLGYYWCECDKLPESHTLEDHHPHVWRQLEQQGVEFEWYDEWVIDTDHDKAYRQHGDMHGWQPSFVWTDDGVTMLTPDDDPIEWIVWATNDARHCIPTRILKRQQVLDAGWVLIHDRLENGLHIGMDDDPHAYLEMEQDKAKQAGLKYDYLFMLDETSQFYITFSMFAKEQEEES